MLTTIARLSLLLCAVAIPAAAQVRPPSPFEALGEKSVDPARLAALMANSQRSIKPATYVLGHKTDLALTADQVRQLELLARSEEDSAIVRQIRLTAATARLSHNQQNTAYTRQSGWVGPINEKQLRDEACEHAAITVEYAIGMMRDRQAVGTILTGTQIDRLPELEASDALHAIKRKEP